MEKPKAQIGVLRKLYNRLAEIVRESPGHYYRLVKCDRGIDGTLISGLVLGLALIDVVCV